MYGKFGKRFAQHFGRGDWEGWTPPWMQRDWQGPRGPHFGGHPHHHEFHGHGHRGHFGPGWQWGSPEFQALRTEGAEVARLFAIASQGAIENRERLAQLRAFLDRSHKELSDMIYGTTAQTESPSSTPDVGQA